MKRCWSDLLIAAALAGFLAVVLPLQTYLGNSELFVFTPARLAAELAVVFVALTLVGWLLARLGSRWVPGLVEAVLVAALVLTYLESGPLSAGLPEVNGGFQAELVVPSRRIWDLAVWVGVLTVALATVRWTREYLHWVALAVLAISVGSLFEVRSADSAAASVARPASDRAAFEWQLDIIDNFRFSSHRNVLVFILDSMPGNVAAATLEGDAELRSQFPGFTAYPDCVGMYDCTKYGLPALMTGEYLGSSVTLAEYTMLMYGERSFLRPYLAALWEVSFVPDLMPYGLTTAPIVRRNPVIGTQKHGWAALLLRSREVPYLSLLDFTVFRLMPYAAKAPFLYAKIRHDPMIGKDESSFWYEHMMYDHLAKAEIADIPAALGVFHSRGAHPPLVFDAEGRRLAEPRFGYDIVPTLVRNPLVQLGRLLKRLRERGLYDGAFILVVADHGLGVAPCEEGHNPSESVILWVKPEGAAGEWRIDARPTGYSRVAGLMRQVPNGGVTAAVAAAALGETSRRFYFQQHDRLVEAVVGGEAER